MARTGWAELSPTSYYDPEIGIASPAWQVTMSSLEYW